MPGLTAPTATTRDYFQWLADATKVVLDDCGGVVVLSREEFFAEIGLVDERLRSLPDTIQKHPTLGLKRRKISAEAYAGRNPDIMLIWDTEMFRDEQGAREALERHEFGEPDTRIAELDASPRLVALATI